MLDNPMQEMSPFQIINFTPIDEMLDILDFKPETVKDYEKIRGVYAKYTAATYFLNVALQDMWKGSKRDLIANHKTSIERRRMALLAKHPYLKHNRKSKQSYLVDQLGDFVSKEDFGICSDLANEAMMEDYRRTGEES